MPDLLTPLSATLNHYQQGQLGLTALTQQWRQAAIDQQPPLPQRYRDVLDRILTQLESSALFTEESCSFSQSDIFNALNEWLSKAQAWQQLNQ